MKTPPDPLTEVYTLGHLERQKEDTNNTRTLSFFIFRLVSYATKVSKPLKRLGGLQEVILGGKYDDYGGVVSIGPLQTVLLLGNFGCVFVSPSKGTTSVEIGFGS